VIRQNVVAAIGAISLLVPSMHGPMPPALNTVSAVIDEQPAVPINHVVSLVQPIQLSLSPIGLDIT